MSRTPAATASGCFVLVALLREAPWLTRRRLRDYSSLLIAVYVLAAIWFVAGPGMVDATGRPVGADFLSFWTVSKAVHEGQAASVYEPERLAALEQAVNPGPPRFYAWAYPPSALLIVYPLAWLPYLAALAAWLALGLGLYLRVLWRILPRPLALWSGLAFPAVFICVSFGQNGLLTTALLGGALTLLTEAPVAAGVLIGVLTFKPQLGLLIPLALLAGGHWRAIAAAAVTAIALAALALLLFGADTGAAFLAQLPFARAMLETPFVPYFKMQSMFAAARLLGGGVTTAYLAQAVVTLAAGAVTVWAWRRPGAPDLKHAILVTAGLLATPFVFAYDLTLLALPIAWLARRDIDEGMRPWEGTALAAAFLLPFLAQGIAEFAHLATAPFVEGALLSVLARRLATTQSPT